MARLEAADLLRARTWSNSLPELLSVSCVSCLRGALHRPLDSHTEATGEQGDRPGLILGTSDGQASLEVPIVRRQVVGLNDHLQACGVLVQVFDVPMLVQSPHIDRVAQQKRRVRSKEHGG